MSLDGVQLHLVDTIDGAMALKNWMGERRDILAIDSETCGLRWWEHRVRLVQLGDTMHGWAIPWQTWGGVFKEVIESYRGPIVGHNLTFDCKMIEHWSKIDGFPITFDRTQLHDTRIMGHILNPTRATGLKPLASQFVDAKAARASTILDEAMTLNKWTWATVPMDFEPYWVYGALDTVLTARLWSVLKPQVMATAPKAYDLEMAFTWVVEKMERKGIQLDVEYTQERLGEFRTYCGQAEAWCEESYGVRPGQNQQVIKRLQADGVQFTKLTKSGANFALDREVLEAITAQYQHPLADVVLQRRRMEKLASTYLENFLRLQVDGRIHPSFNTLKTEDSGYGARTGRASVTEPALQTLPRRSNANPSAIAVRNCIIGSDGCSLMMSDQAQIEMRLFGHFSQDPGLIAAFSHGDFFLNVVRELWNEPTMEKSDERRQHGKNGMYALGYGAGAEKIALTTGQTLEAVLEFLGLLGQRFPGIKQFQRQVNLVAKQRSLEEGSAYVLSPLTGRKLIADAGKEYALVNYLVQGTAAEVLKLKNVEMDAAGLDEFMILDVHDEVLLDVPDEQIDDVTVTVNRIMNDDQLFRVPLEAETTVAKRWGEASK